MISLRRLGMLVSLLAVMLHPSMSSAGWYSLTVDDGLVPGTPRAAQILDANRIPGTFFVPSEFPGQYGHVTADQVRAILKGKRHRLGAHTRHHSILTGYLSSPVRLAQQIWGSKVDLETIFGVGVSSFSYPQGIGGTIKQIRQEILDARFDGARGTDCDVVSRNSDPYNIPSCSFQTGVSIEFMMGKGGEAAAENGWVIYVIHQIDTTEQYSVSSADLQRLINHNRSLGLVPITFEEGVNTFLLNRVGMAVQP